MPLSQPWLPAFRRKRTADWRTVPLRPGALFVVGDPKQSIYRFRRADIEIYNAVRERFSDPAIGRVVPLTTNFRSVPALCEWANDVFDGPFPTEPTAHSPRFAPLDPKSTTAVEADDRAGLFTLTHACDERRTCRRATRRRSRATSGPRSTPAAASTATS